jgi:hypothetical protein
MGTVLGILTVTEREIKTSQREDLNISDTSQTVTVLMTESWEVMTVLGRTKREKYGDWFDAECKQVTHQKL